MTYNCAVLLQGVLVAMRGQLTSADYWRSSDRGSAASAFLQLLAIIIPWQRPLHPQVSLSAASSLLQHLVANNCTHDIAVAGFQEGIVMASGSKDLL